MASIYTHIDRNKRETLLILIAFIMFISVLGFALGFLFGETSFDAISFMGFALIFSGVTGFISYYNSDKMVLAISNAHQISETDAPDLHKLVENMCIASGLPKPKVYLIEDTALNAFATGRDPEHAVIVLTTGLVQKLEKRELEGVIAHELSHVGNYDIRLMSLVSILVGSITLLADWFTRGTLYGGKRKSSDNMGGIILLIALVLLVISPVIAQLIKLAMSRNREFLADSTAAIITRYPQGLASALRKISADTEILEAANGATAHLYISNPLKNGGGLAKLFDTHPPVEERIARLESM